MHSGAGADCATGLATMSVRAAQCTLGGRGGKAALAPVAEELGASAAQSHGKHGATMKTYVLGPGMVLGAVLALGACGRPPLPPGGPIGGSHSGAANQTVDEIADQRAMSSRPAGKAVATHEPSPPVTAVPPGMVTTAAPQGARASGGQPINPQAARPGQSAAPQAPGAAGAQAPGVVPVPTPVPTAAPPAQGAPGVAPGTSPAPGPSVPAPAPGGGAPRTAPPGAGAPRVAPGSGAAPPSGGGTGGTP